MRGSLNLFLTSMAVAKICQVCKTKEKEEEIHILFNDDRVTFGKSSTDDDIHKASLQGNLLSKLTCIARFTLIFCCFQSLGAFFPRIP